MAKVPINDWAMTAVAKVKRHLIVWVVRGLRHAMLRRVLWSTISLTAGLVLVLVLVDPSPAHALRPLR